MRIFEQLENFLLRILEQRKSARVFDFSQKYYAELEAARESAQNIIGNGDLKLRIKIENSLLTPLVSELTSKQTGLEVTIVDDAAVEHAKEHIDGKYQYELNWHTHGYGGGVSAEMIGLVDFASHAITILIPIKDWAIAHIQADIDSAMWEIVRDGIIIAIWKSITSKKIDSRNIAVVTSYYDRATTADAPSIIFEIPPDARSEVVQQLVDSIKEVTTQTIIIHEKRGAKIVTYTYVLEDVGEWALSIEGAWPPSKSQAQLETINEIAQTLPCVRVEKSPFGHVELH